MDQCKHCILRGDFNKCRKTPCSHRESWGFREAVEQAHMAGQADAGRDPEYSNAQAYFQKTHVKKKYGLRDEAERLVGLPNLRRHSVDCQCSVCWQDTVYPGN